MTIVREPRVSFLMATNESGPHFKRAVRSCLEQSYADFELVIVANGVTDDQYAEVAECCGQSNQIRLFRTTLKRLTFSLNLGLHEARGEYVARMDSDDICYPMRLAEQVDFLDRNPRVTLCGAWCDLVNLDDEVIGDWKYPIEHAAIKRALLFSNPICHPTVMFRRDAILRHGGYSGFFAEDYVTWALLSVDPNIEFANIPKKMIAYRASHAGHRRNLTWRNAKAVSAGVQVQIFGITHNPKWLFGALFNVLKTFLR